MRADWSHLEKWRIRDRSAAGDHFGGFFCPHPTKGHLRFAIIATDGLDMGEGWEHVSVKVHDINGTVRLPGYEEMKHVKSLFWEPTETVVEYHVPDSARINCHPCVLHLWRPTQQVLPLPPAIFV